MTKEELDLLDVFAGQAMHGVLGGERNLVRDVILDEKKRRPGIGEDRALASACYNLATEMIKERAERRKGPQA